MKLVVLFAALAAASFAQSSAPAKKTAPAKKAAPAKAAAPAKQQPKKAAAPAKPAQPDVPKDAVKLSDTEWRWVDKDGKAWIYRRTPFSIAKFPEEQRASESGPARDAAAPLEARDAGDSVEFIRRTPFGESKWTKKKSELDQHEKAAWDAAAKKQELE